MIYNIKEELKMSDIIKAPIPGTVWEINVVEGQTVKVDDPLLVLEAMKMQNDILSLYSGTVSKIFVNKGDSVSVNTDLIEII